VLDLKKDGKKRGIFSRKGFYLLARPSMATLGKKKKRTRYVKKRKEKIKKHKIKLTRISIRI
jgi:hypothetical protein